MIGHTPGPWELIHKSIEINGLWEPNGINIESKTGETVVGDEGLYAGERDEANARLIAAAPELLDALRNLSGIVDAAIIGGDWKVDGACDPDMDIARARAAIAKATPTHTNQCVAT